MPKSLRHIDDLRGASEGRIRAAMKKLDIRSILTKQWKLEEEQKGLTLDEYNKIVAGRKPKDCHTCGGTGKLIPPKPREVGVIHPSSSHGCRLRLYYDVTGELQPIQRIKKELRITFKIGHVLHDFTQDTLLRALGSEVFVPEPVVDIMGFIRGNTDGIIDFGDVRGVLEIKTIGNEYDDLKKPKSEHRNQANGMYATGLDCPFVVYLYISKAWPYPMKQYIETYDPEIFSTWVRRKGEPVEKALKAGKPPIADARKSECGDCPYNHACKQSLDKSSASANIFKRKSRRV